MNIKVIEDWILVKPLEGQDAEQKTATGLIVPLEAQKKTEVKRARVIQISNDVDMDTIHYKEDDVILYYGKTGISFYEEGEQYTFLKFDGMLAIEEKVKMPLGGGEDYTSSKV